ncbi:TPA: transposase, partial [Escherichia coli]|nr:transposase [Escherichia coli]
KVLRSDLKLSDIKAIIPHKSNEKARTDERTQLDKETDRKRNVVERSFGLLKQNRRIATRYEKTARNYLSMVQLGCIRLFLRRIYIVEGHCLVALTCNVPAHKQKCQSELANWPGL